jgi:DNA-directed RNA polymerase subunit M/transcription elongation factor TFIIS
MLVVRPDVPVICPKCKTSDMVHMRVYLRHETHNLDDYCCLRCRYEWNEKEEDEVGHNN